MPAPISPKKALAEWKLYIFLVPSLILILVFSYYPAISAIYHSFFRWNGGESKEFIGFQNYVQIFNDKIFLQSFLTIGILIIANLLKMIPSIIMAVIIHRLTSTKFQYWYRVLLVLPMVVPGLVTLFIWKFFFNPNLGALNYFMEFSGLKTVVVHLDQFFGWGGIFLNDFPISWLGEPQLIVPSLIIWGFPWIGAVGVLMFIAGLQSIGTEIYEAADLDGIGPIGKFIYIEFPLIITQIRVIVVLMMIGTLQSFGMQFLLLGENGGPGGAGMVPGLWMFNRAFIAGEFGYACALGLCLFVVILGMTFINNKFLRVEK
jgi:raffinose/stachyose/melibiose transport system permease protein